MLEYPAITADISANSEPKKECHAWNQELVTLDGYNWTVVSYDCTV